MNILLVSGVYHREKRGYYTHYIVNRDLIRDVAVELERMAVQARERYDSQKRMSTLAAGETHKKSPAFPAGLPVFLGLSYSPQTGDQETMPSPVSLW